MLEDVHRADEATLDILGRLGRRVEELGALVVATYRADELSRTHPLRVVLGQPLWYYVLKEAEVIADGLRLGPVGGRIVAEVFVGLLQTDPGSYLAMRPR